MTFSDAIDSRIHARIGAFVRALDSAGKDGILEVVPSYSTVAVWYDPDQVAYPALMQRLTATARTVSDTPPKRRGRRHVIPVRYDGPDLAHVSRETGLSMDTVVERHGGREYQVYVVGFVPGFGFLGDLDDALVLPRRAEPRKRVPAGSVAIAGRQTGVYPLSTPGGWHLIGSTTTRLFDPSGDPPALLAPGDRVVFEAVG